jgi:predicted ribonuclease YlaK
MDVAKLIDVRGDDIHILVPMVIVEELDGLKQRGDNHARWRAGRTLAVLERVLPQPAAPGQLRVANSSQPESDGIPRGEVSVELVFDAPGHVRLPVNDDEIIDRLLTAQPLADRPITLITYDTNQAFKARAAGLRAIRLKMPIESEPEPKSRGKRRNPAQEITDTDNGEGNHDGPREAGRQHSPRINSADIDRN